MMAVPSENDVVGSAPPAPARSRRAVRRNCGRTPPRAGQNQEHGGHSQARSECRGFRHGEGRLGADQRSSRVLERRSTRRQRRLVDRSDCGRCHQRIGTKRKLARLRTLERLEFCVGNGPDARRWDPEHEKLEPHVHRRAEICDLEGDGDTVRTVVGVADRRRARDAGRPIRGIGDRDDPVGLDRSEGKDRRPGAAVQ